MKETSLSPESEKIITREEVINAYRKFVEQGAKDPADLDNSNPEVGEANNLWNRWREQEDTRSKDNQELEHRTNLAKTMLYIDAGFTDPTYLRDVLGWLVQDAQNAEKQKDNPQRTETRREIAAAMKKIRALLEESKH